MEDEGTLMAHAAWLYYVGDFTQAETAERLGITRARVNRLLADARERGIVTITVEDRTAAMLPLQEAIAARYGLSQCIVTPPVGDAAALRAVGIAAANLLRRELAAHPSLTIGVGWGRTLDEMARHATRISAPKARFISLMGSLTTDAAANPFDVVHQLARRTGAEGYFLPVPFIADSAENRATFMSQRVVTQAVAMAKAAQIAFISVGELTEDALLRRQNMISPKDRERLRAAGAVADTNGAFYDASGAVVDDPLTERTLAVPLAELSARIVLLSAGRAKATATRALLSSGLVDVAVIDGDCAPLLAEPAGI